MACETVLALPDLSTATRPWDPHQDGCLRKVLFLMARPSRSALSVIFMDTSGPCWVQAIACLGRRVDVPPSCLHTDTLQGPTSMGSPSNHPTPARAGKEGWKPPVLKCQSVLLPSSPLGLPTTYGGFSLRHFTGQETEAWGGC